MLLRGGDFVPLRCPFAVKIFGIHIKNVNSFFIIFPIFSTVEEMLLCF